MIAVTPRTCQRDGPRRGDVADIGSFFAEEYFFVYPRGQRLTRAERLANFGRAGRSSTPSQLTPILAP